ncbi:hypothetical protein FVEN_g13067 [Fusarium venenatum]|nr:hypothetical protein FVEN_g13067 [Fusarium venenatum]
MNECHERSIEHITGTDEGDPEPTTQPALENPHFDSRLDTSELIAKLDKGWRRCIVATNIPELSITVQGVVYVVDSSSIRTLKYIRSSALKVRRPLPHKEPVVLRDPSQGFLLAVHYGDVYDTISAALREPWEVDQPLSLKVQKAQRNTSGATLVAATNKVA